MAEIKADGDGLINCGNNIIELVDQYEKTIEALFNSLTKLNKGAWSGSAADTYVAKAEVERLSFNNFGSYLKMYGKVLKNTGDNINRIVTKWDDR